MRRHTDDDRGSDPILITEAARSYDEEFAERKRRYSIIMAFRIPCMILAGVAYLAFGWAWVAVAFIVLSVPLPWVAVLIANDRLPDKARKVSRYRRESSGLGPVDERRILEAAEVLEARSARTDGSRQEQQDGAEHAPPQQPRAGAGG